VANIFKDKRSLERFKENLYKTPTLPNQLYHWVFGLTKGGKKVVWGPYYTATEADRVLSTLDDGEIFELSTRDVTRATREIKSDLMKRGEEPDEVLKRVRHGRS